MMRLASQPMMPPTINQMMMPMLELLLRGLAQRTPGSGAVASLRRDA
jgi:hypothetical protein